MNATSSINLIKTKAGISPETDFIVSTLTRIATVVVIIVIVLGALVSGLFYYFYMGQKRMSEEQATLTESIAADKVKESLLLATEKRVSTINKILAIQKNWGAGFDQVSAVTGGSTLTSVSVSEENKVIVQFTVKSLDDVISIVEKVKAEVVAKHLRDPQLVSLTLDKSNEYSVALSFTGLF